MAIAILSRKRFQHHSLAFPSVLYILPWAGFEFLFIIWSRLSLAETWSLIDLQWKQNALGVGCSWLVYLGCLHCWALSCSCWPLWSPALEETFLSPSPNHSHVIYCLSKCNWLNSTHFYKVCLSWSISMGCFINTNSRYILSQIQYPHATAQ